MLTIKFRYKSPESSVSKLIEKPVYDTETSIDNSSENFVFAASVAEFGMLLRNSSFKSKAGFEQVLQLARHATGADKEDYRKEFVGLVEKAKELTGTAMK